MLLLVVASSARAYEYVEPEAAGWLLDARDDAPTDARLLFEANFLVAAEITRGPGSPVELSADFEVTQAMGNDPAVVVFPPTGDWQPGQAYTVEADGAAYGTTGAPTFPLSFTVGDEPAAEPVAPTVVDVDAGAWSKHDQPYLENCCLPVRDVQVTLRSEDPDPWSSVELLGHFPGPSDLTTSPEHSRLGLAVGPGEHTIGFRQWDDEGDLNPTCFGAVGLAADGQRSGEVRICVERSGRIRVDGEPLGCATAPGGGGLVPMLALGLSWRRRSRR